MKTLTVRIRVPEGLHVKPASKIFMEARKYGCRITAVGSERQADCKNIMELLSLEAAFGEELRFEFDGAGEEKAREAFKLLLRET